MAAADVVKKIEGAPDILKKDEKGHSLLKKYLSKDVVDSLKSKKTAMGASLWDCIQSGKLAPAPWEYPPWLGNSTAPALESITECSYKKRVGTLIDVPVQSAKSCKSPIYGSLEVNGATKCSCFLSLTSSRRDKFVSTFRGEERSGRRLVSFKALFSHWSVQPLLAFSMTPFYLDWLSCLFTPQASELMRPEWIDSGPSSLLSAPCYSPHLGWLKPLAANCMCNIPFTVTSS